MQRSEDEDEDDRCKSGDIGHESSAEVSLQLKDFQLKEAAKLSAIIKTEHQFRCHSDFHKKNIQQP